MIGFAIGLFMGGIVGVVVMCLCVAAKDNEDQYCEYCIYFDEPMECKACQDCIVKANFVRMNIKQN
jgi:hypothetical protein